MCGIAGIWALKSKPAEQVLAAQARQMAERIRHRGPDESGVWIDAAQSMALAHRRLSILDLSPTGHQPMLSASGRFVLSYNGEIYNYRALRARLDYPWKGTSDTEVILAAIEAWGVEAALQAFNGMFAFALWDNETHTLTLARDRMGEKPLYYGLSGGDVIFASELKAFRAFEGFAPTIDRTALTQYLRYLCVPAPRSIYEGIFKLPPAHYLQLNAKDCALRLPPSKAYWSYADMVQQSRHQLFEGGDEAMTDALEALLKQAVALRMVSDVPLGAFLSGGIDSSCIVALMQAQSSQPVKTFTIGFGEGEFNEAPHARAVAQHLGTDHTELMVSPQQALQVIADLPALYDEPFADSSQIPTYLVSQLARTQVTVALSGDAGDELFGGYNRYSKGADIWQIARKLPQPLRQALGVYALEPLIGGLHKTIGLPQRFFRLSQYSRKLGAKDSAAFYRALCSQCLSPEALVLGGFDAPIEEAQVSGLTFAEWMMLQDAVSYLPNDILAKVDRAAMGVSLETRVPLLDVDVMAFAWRMPLTAKIRQRESKWLLRQVLYRYVPRALIERRKTGFSVPLSQWLCSDLKEWAQTLLSPETIAAQGYLDAASVQRVWREQQSGARDRSGLLWSLLMFQSWLAAQE